MPKRTVRDGRKPIWENIRTGRRNKEYVLHLTPDQLLELLGQHNAAGHKPGEECPFTTLHFYGARERYFRSSKTKPPSRRKSVAQACQEGYFEDMCICGACHNTRLAAKFAEEHAAAKELSRRARALAWSRGRQAGVAEMQLMGAAEYLKKYERKEKE